MLREYCSHLDGSWGGYYACCQSPSTFSLHPSVEDATLGIGSKVLMVRNQVNVFLDDMANFAEMNGVYEKYFAHKPARSCVAVKQLPKGVPVEIECIAFVGKAAKL